MDQCERKSVSPWAVGLGGGSGGVPVDPPAGVIPPPSPDETPPGSGPLAVRSGPKTAPVLPQGAREERRWELESAEEFVGEDEAGDFAAEAFFPGQSVAGGDQALADAGAFLYESVRLQGQPTGLRSPLETQARRVRQASGRESRRTLQKPTSDQRHLYSPEQRLLLIDTWRRSGLPVKDFAALVGLSQHTLYKWNQNFERHGPEGLMDAKRGAGKESRQIGRASCRERVYHPV